MLVLSRKPGERILVGPDVKITVIRIGPNSVRIGIDAPGHLHIVREELEVRFGTPGTGCAMQGEATQVQMTITE